MTTIKDKIRDLAWKVHEIVTKKEDNEDVSVEIEEQVDETADLILELLSKISGV